MTQHDLHQGLLDALLSATNDAERDALASLAQSPQKLRAAAKMLMIDTGEEDEEDDEDDEDDEDSEGQDEDEGETDDEDEVEEEDEEDDTDDFEDEEDEDLEDEEEDNEEDPEDDDEDDSWEVIGKIHGYPLYRNTVTGEEHAGDEPDLFPEDADTAPVNYAWSEEDEKKHPRDHGKFAKKPGDSGSGSSAAPETASPGEAASTVTAKPATATSATPAKDSQAAPGAASDANDWVEQKTKAGYSIWHNPLSGATVRGKDKPTTSVAEHAKVTTRPLYDPVSYNVAKRNLKSFFGREDLTDEQIGSMLGAQPGSTVSIHTGFGDKVSFDVSHPKIQEQIRNLTRHPDGSISVTNTLFLMKKKHQGGGFGTKVFAEQVQNLANLGVSHIDTLAGKGHGMNGYYTWPRLGYDAPLPEKVIKKLKKHGPPDLRDSKTVLDLYATKEGREWWSQHGEMLEMKFDLTPGSRSITTLNNYLASKKQPELKINSLEEVTATRNKMSVGHQQSKARQEAEAKRQRAHQAKTASMRHWALATSHAQVLGIAPEDLQQLANWHAENSTHPADATPEEKLATGWEKVAKDTDYRVNNFLEMHALRSKMENELDSLGIGHAKEKLHQAATKLADEHLAKAKQSGVGNPEREKEKFLKDAYHEAYVDIITTAL